MSDLLEKAIIGLLNALTDLIREGIKEIITTRKK